MVTFIPSGCGGDGAGRDPALLGQRHSQHHSTSTNALKQDAQASPFRQHCIRLEHECPRRSAASQTPRLQHTASKPAVARRRPPSLNRRDARCPSRSTTSPNTLFAVNRNEHRVLASCHRLCRRDRAHQHAAPGIAARRCVPIGSRSTLRVCCHLAPGPSQHGSLARARWPAVAQCEARRAAAADSFTREREHKHSHAGAAAVVRWRG
jgi:hypothetical protein